MTAGVGKLTSQSAQASTPKVLYAPSAFSSGSSISHMDFDTYETTSDFLMIPAVSTLAGSTYLFIISFISNYVRVDQLIARFGGSQVYGPGILAIMTSIGWPSTMNGTVASIMINPSQGAVAGSNTVQNAASVSVASFFALLVSVAVLTL